MPSTLPDPSATRRLALGSAMEKLRHRWGLFVGLGILAVVLGIVALGLVVTATVTTVYIVALFMVIKGGSDGLLVIVGWPTNSLVILGTLLGVDLVFTGVMWVGFGLRLRGHA